MKLKGIVYLSLLLLSIVSCEHDMQFDDSVEGNFDALWNIIDKRYCYFDYKAEQYGLDWDYVYTTYKKRIQSTTSNSGLFEILCDMLAELRDGHVNLYTSSNVGRYWNWYTDYPANFSAEIINDNYLGNDYQISGGIKYRILSDNVGYMYIGDFSSSISNSGMDAVLTAFALCNGIIVDIRDNGGGVLENATLIASRFTEKRVHVGYMMHKTGPGHSDFSSPSARYIDPDRNHERWQKSVVVLTNRSCYSASNVFVSDMKLLDNVVVMGDSTGGGGGMPMSSMLPNGWSVRYSAAPILDAMKEHIEFGVAPDVMVSMSESDKKRGVDTIIETARRYINNLVK